MAGSMWQGFSFLRSIIDFPARNQVSLSRGAKAQGSDELGFEEKLRIHVESSSSSSFPDGLCFLEKETEKRKAGSEVKLQRRMKRSNLLAKQVISFQSALSLGFVSQLWVDTSSWVVLVVEVRPNLLSGESERFLLRDVIRVGDVVLVEDESVIENDFKMVALETLVGYRVVTPRQQSIGKVRGYTFNIKSGTVESLELDSFGISIIPSSLVSTYALLVKDILEVVSDTVVVHEAAASQIRRLTKGLWDAQSIRDSSNELGMYSQVEKPDSLDKSWRKRRSPRSKRTRQKMRGKDDDWGLPLDYL